MLDDQLAADVITTRLAEARRTTGVARGERLEEALALGCSQVPGWRVRDTRLRTENEELDIVVANSSARAPWNGSAYVLFEAKNWSTNVDRAEYDSFHMKVVERGGACRIGFFVAAAGFSSGFYKRAEHFGTQGVSIVPMSVPWLEGRVRDEGIEPALTQSVERVVLDRTWEEEGFK